MNVSASQIKTFRRCQRKWALQKVAGLKEPETPQQALGKAVHAALEAWVRDGTPLPDGDVGAIAMAAVRHTAPPRDLTATSEIWFKFPSPTLEGVTYLGFIDLAWHPEGRVPECLDYKTTTAGFRWAMGQSQLREDPQALIYAYALLVHLIPDAPALDLKWLYLARSVDRPAAHPVLLTVVRDTGALEPEQAFEAAISLADVKAGVRDLDQTVLEMIAVRDDCAGDAMRASPNANACGDYGGCPFQHVCKLSPQEKMRSIMSLESLKEKLARSKKATEAPAETPKAQEDMINSPPRSKSEEKRRDTQSGPSGQVEIRDYLAGQALAGLLSRNNMAASEAASEAYAYADACLKARG